MKSRNMSSFGSTGPSPPTFSIGRVRRRLGELDVRSANHVIRAFSHFSVLANLAVSFAQAGKRTLLIDGDMRRPGLSSLLELRAQCGLSDVLRSELPVAEAAQAHIKRLEVEGLEVLPCGPRPSNRKG